MRICAHDHDKRMAPVRPHTTGKNVFINPKNRACSLIRSNTVIQMIIQLSTTVKAILYVYEGGKGLSYSLGFIFIQSSKCSFGQPSSRLLVMNYGCFLPLPINICVLFNIVQ